MKRTRLVACTLATFTLLVLGGCSGDGSDDSEAGDPVTSATAPAAEGATTTPAPTTAPTTPSPTTTTRTPSTTGAPSSTFIDYEVVSDDGVLIASPADTSKLTGAPKDFTTFMGALITRQATAGNEGCSEPPQIYVTQVDTGGWARGGYFTPGCGGSAALWARSGGAWTQAWSGQSLVDCATLDRYAFPSRLAGNSCDTGQGTRTYRR